jgi:hypothetical protein
MRAGINALKYLLNKLLVDITRRSFQEVAVDIRRRIRKLEQQLEIMGPSGADEISAAKPPHQRRFEIL